MWPLISWDVGGSSSRSGGGDGAIHKALGRATNCLNLVLLKQLNNLKDTDKDIAARKR